MADPAALTVAVAVTGLTPAEAATAFANLPAGATATVHITQPPLGGKRYALAAECLSVLGAMNFTAALYAHVDEVLNPADEKSAP